MVIIQTGLAKKVIFWIVSSLKGISQVFLIENAVTGFIILVAITTSSFVLGVMAFASSFVGTIIGKIAGGDEKTVKQGLFGYNSVLTGMALTILLSGEYHWIIALSGAIVAAIVTAALMNVMKSKELPILTFPFIIVTWFTLLSTYRLKAFKLTDELVPQGLAYWNLDIKGEIDWTAGIFGGIGQILFLEQILPGILLFIALFWAGWKYGLYAIIGNLAAVLAAYGLGGEHHLIFVGLYGYNAILTIIAVSIAYNDNHHYGPLTGVIAACVTVPIMASIATFLIPFGLPALTMPFVLGTWLFLGARKVLPRL